MLRYDAHTFRQTTYLSGPPFPKKADLYLSLFGIFQSLGNYEVEQIARGTAMHAIQEGEGTIEFKGQRYTAGPGDLFILRKNNHYLYYDHPSKPWKHSYFILSGLRVEEYLDAIGLTADRPVISITGSNKIWLKLNLLKEHIPAHGIGGVEAVRTGWELFELLKERCDRDALPKAYMLAETAKHIIDTSPHIITNVNLLAESLRISRVSLFRQFKQRYDISVKEYMNQVRFERIEQILRVSTLSVNEAARMAGFENPQYFRRLFQETYGQTPTQWRNKQLAAEKKKRQANTKT